MITIRDKVRDSCIRPWLTQHTRGFAWVIPDSRPIKVIIRVDHKSQVEETFDGYEPVVNAAKWIDAQTKLLSLIMPEVHDERPYQNQ